MLEYYSWLNFSDVRIVTQSIIIGIVLLSYLWIVFLDFKYKEMQLWKVLIPTGLNLILPIIPIFIWSEFTLLKILSILAIPVWLFILVLNTKFNKEKVIGQADIDVFSAQFCISSVIIIWILNTVIPEASLLIALMAAQIMFSSLFVGLVGLVIVWSLKILICKFKNKDKKFRELVEEHGQVPTIVAFLPLIIINLYIVMAL